MDLYRFFDDHGDLLYIGISLSAAARASEHRSDKGWWQQVAWMDVEHLPEGIHRLEAEARERTAIRQERPRYNVAGAGPSRGPWGYTPPATPWLATPANRPPDSDLSPMAEWALHTMRCRCARERSSSFPMRHLHATLSRRVSTKRAQALLEELVADGSCTVLDDVVHLVGFEAEQAAATPWLARQERQQLAMNQHRRAGGP